jgi:HSP20 family protein
MDLLYALDDPLLQLDWTLNNLLHENKLNKTSGQHGQKKTPATKPQTPAKSPHWAGVGATGTAGLFDVIETPDALELVTDAPGLDTKDIAINFIDGVLTISGTHPNPSMQQAVPDEQQPQDQGQDQTKAAEAKQPTAQRPPATVKYWCKERRQYDFVRGFRLPDDVKADDISAHLDKGVLTMRVPKLPPAPKPQPKRIAVQAAPAKAA